MLYNGYCDNPSCQLCGGEGLKRIPEGTYKEYKEGRKVFYSDAFVDTWLAVSQYNIDVVLTEKGLVYRWRS